MAAEETWDPLDDILGDMEKLSIQTREPHAPKPQQQAPEIAQWRPKTVTNPLRMLGM